jgi:hypothetical protein
MIRRNIFPPPSGSKSNASKKPVETEEKLSSLGTTRCYNTKDPYISILSFSPFPLIWALTE